MEHCSRPAVLHKTSTMEQSTSWQAVKDFSPKLPCRLQKSLTLKSIFREISLAHIFSNDNLKFLFHITLQYFIQIFWSKFYMHFSSLLFKIRNIARPLSLLFHQLKEQVIKQLVYFVFSNTSCFVLRFRVTICSKYPRL